MATIEEVQQAIKSWAAGTYRGITTDTLGAPVDIINLAISPITKPLGIYSDNPAFGSKHLRQIAGMPTEDANIIETASGMTSPGGAVHAMIVGAARLGRAVAGEKALQSGENMAEVFNKTGAYMDADKKWKTVISDKSATIDELSKFNLDSNFGMPLSKVMDHPKLYEAYPQLKDYQVYSSSKLSPGSAEFHSNTQSIKIGTPRLLEGDELKNIILHETQHAVQDIEGYSRGSNPEFHQKYPPGAEEKLLNADQKLGIKAGSAEDYAADRFEKKIKADREQAFTKYANNPGEQEARFTENNMNLSEEGLGASVLRLLRNEKSPQSWDTRVGNK
jgi:hypothetical protein